MKPVKTAPKTRTSRPAVVDTMDDEDERMSSRIVHVPIERRLPIGGIEIDPSSNRGGIEVEVLSQILHHLTKTDRVSDEGPITDSFTFEYGAYRVEVNLGDAVQDQ